jgi:CheY-like chemotaxis protein
VLLVDDDKTARDTAATLLARLGFQVLLAADGDEALTCFRRSTQAIRCMLLDATIPGLPGCELVSRLRAERPGIAVVLSSGYSEAEVMKSYAGVRLDGFIIKPLDFSLLSCVMRESLAPLSPATRASERGNPTPAWPPRTVWA